MVSDMKDLNDNIVSDDSEKADLLNSFSPQCLLMNHLENYPCLISDIKVRQ